MPCSNRFAGAPLARELAGRAPGAFLTVVTPTGLKVASDTLDVLTSSLAPLDFVTAVRRVLRFARPRALLLTETELWPNLLHEARQRAVPALLVNGRISHEKMARYRRLAGLYRPLLAGMHLIGAQLVNKRVITLRKSRQLNVLS